MLCADFFVANPEGKKFKLLVNKTEEELAAWEKQSASQFSPGPVADAETVYHQILDPTNLTETRDGLSPKSFDTATGIGLSVNRLAHATLDQIKELGNTRARNHNEAHPNNPQTRSLWGLVPIEVSLVRSMISKVTNTRGLYVFDTAKQDDISHADISQLTKDQRGIRAVRLELYDIVKGAAFRIE